MCQGHYSPRLSRPVVSRLYQLGQKLKQPMTVLADRFVQRGLDEAENNTAQTAVQEASGSYRG